MRTMIIKAPVDLIAGDEPFDVEGFIREEARLAGFANVSSIEKLRPWKHDRENRVVPFRVRGVRGPT